MPEAPPVTSADMPGLSSISPAQGWGGAAEELLRNRSGEGARCEAGRIDWVYKPVGTRNCRGRSGEGDEAASLSRHSCRILPSAVPVSVSFRMALARQLV